MHGRSRLTIGGVENISSGVAVHGGAGERVAGRGHTLGVEVAVGGRAGWQEKGAEG